MDLELVIIDDAAFIREAIRNCVETAGIKVIGEASDGEEALEVVTRLKPDIVVMDLVMPKLNGVELAGKLLEQQPDLKILACSTESQKEMVLKALQAGCHDFISKPFTSQEMKEKILTMAKA